MKNIIISFLIILPLWLNGQNKNQSKTILMVVSSYGKDQGATRPGYEFDEFSQAYLVFTQNGISIDVASPQGGKVEPDKFNKDKAYNKVLLGNTQAMKLLNSTKSTVSLRASDYDAVYVVGGKGAMFDLPFDPALQDLILDVYKREGTVIASVCHGPAAFVNIKNDDKYIIKDIELTSFCNVEEDLFGKKWVKEFPFKLEDKLKSRGAKFNQADFMLNHISVSGKFVTGQNPFSTASSAEAVVKALGINPIERKAYKDENSVNLIKDILDKTISHSQAETLLKENSDTYEMNLMAIWGYYKMISAKENREALMKGIAIVELTQPYFFNENLNFVLAKNYIKLGEKEKAKALLNDLHSKGHLKDKVVKLLAEVNG